MAVAGLVEQGGTLAGYAGRLTPVPGSGAIEERLQKGGKVLKAPAHVWLVTRVLVPSAVILRCPKVFHS